RDKKNITVDVYVCWRITEGDSADELLERPVVRFYRGVGTPAVAESRLDSRVRSALSTELGSVDLSDLLKVAEAEELDRATRPLARIAEAVKRNVESAESDDESLTGR